MGYDKNHRRLGDTKKEKFLIVTEEGKFLAAPGDSATSSVEYYDGITGARLLFNSKGVYETNRQLEEDVFQTLWNLPDPINNAYYTQFCTVTKGEADFNQWPPKIFIQENMCSFTFCWKKPGSNKKGCVWLHVGESFEFDVSSAEPWDVPIINAAIVGGNGDYANYFGVAQIETLLRSDETDNSDAVLKLSLYYQKKKNYPKPNNRRAAPVLVDAENEADDEEGIILT